MGGLTFALHYMCLQCFHCLLLCIFETTKVLFMILNGYLGGICLFFPLHSEKHGGLTIAGFALHYMSPMFTLHSNPKSFFLYIRDNWGLVHDTEYCEWVSRRNLSVLPTALRKHGDNCRTCTALYVSPMFALSFTLHIWDN